jgi:teichuronic acid biosynthesis glycosyltransferase TuaH
MNSSIQISIRSTLFHLAKGILKKLRPVLPQSAEKFYTEFRKERQLIDRSKVILYAGNELFPDYPLRHTLEPENNDALYPLKVSLISTVRNEADNVREWLDSLLKQERRPDEVIITDGGSTDGTREIIAQISTSFPIKIHLFDAPKANISHGRNLAIQNASHPIVACSDFGCVLDPHWLQYLITPFERDPNIQLSAGYYQIGGHSILDRLNEILFGINLGAIDPQTFLPSSRSLAMRKTFWEQAGGYPEWLTLSGEDTLFDYQAKSQAVRWAFVPQAKVSWQGPNTLRKLFQTYYRYSVGDGEACTSAKLYWYKTIELIWRSGIRAAFLMALVLTYLIWGPVGGAVILTDWVIYEVYRLIHGSLPMSAKLGVRFFPYVILDEIVGTLQVAGYTRGVLNRPTLLQRQIRLYQQQLTHLLNQYPDRKGVIVYPPTHDWGFMFQRPHQVARALAHQGYLYFFCTQNERSDAVFGFQPIEPGLYLSQVPMQTFSLLKSPIVYIGSAWNRKELIHFDNPYVIYDHYDDLAVSGARPEDHQGLLQSASLVLVTNERLLNRAQEDRSDALLVPNGVDYDYIQQCHPKSDQDTPEDWKPIEAKGKPMVGYSGALASWVDYDLLRSLAIKRKEWEFVLIGVDYDGSLPQSGILNLPNIHWLGMKKYSDLFRYVWRFDVGIIPFKLIPITLSTSPIKLFEYMACGKPVVTTALPDCKIISGALVAEDEEGFLRMLDLAMKKKTDPAYLEIIDQVARRHTWEQRMKDVIAALQYQT